MKSYQQLLAELKRRNVFKVTAVYGALAFVLLQAADLLGQGLRLPDSFMPFITAVILLGFPLALVLTWAFEVTPQGVQRTAAATPGQLEALVAEPAARRWPSGLMALVGIVLLLGGAWWAGRRSAPDSVAAAGAARPEAMQLAYAAPDEDPRPSLAVLPFVNMSAEENQEYFSDGMTEEILNTLAKIEELRVAGRTSAFAYKGRSVDLREIGVELGVRYLIEGSVRKAGDRLRITAQLIDASDGSHLWSEQYDRDLEDVFAIQTEIAGAIAAELRVPLGLADDERLVTPTDDLAAYDLYLAGRTRMRERGESLPEAIRLFEAAIARDSSWAPAWAALAEAQEIGIWYAWAFEPAEPPAAFTERMLAEAEASAARALELDPSNASALVAMGSILRDRHRTKEAETHYRRALAIDPDSPEAHQQYGELLYESGRIAEAVRVLDRATALDPAAIRLTVLGFALRLDDRLAEAVEVGELGIARDPNLEIPQLWGNTGDALFIAGRLEEAAEIYASLLREFGPPPGVATGEITSASIQAIADAIASGRPDRIPERMRALVPPEMWLQMGEEERAIETLREWNVSDGIAWAPQYWLPAFDEIRPDARFQTAFEGEGVSGTNPARTPPSERSRPLILQTTRGIGGDDVATGGGSAVP